jgi:hypothetical protein
MILSGEPCQAVSSSGITFDSAYLELRAALNETELAGQGQDGQCLGKLGVRDEARV